MNDRCTRCGKDFNDFKIDISFSIKVDRLKENSVWEYVPNLDQVSREILCDDCFKKFSDLMSQLNIKHKE